MEITVIDSYLSSFAGPSLHITVGTILSDSVSGSTTSHMAKTASQHSAPLQKQRCAVLVWVDWALAAVSCRDFLVLALTM